MKRLLISFLLCNAIAYSLYGAQPAAAVDPLYPFNMTAKPYSSFANWRADASKLTVEEQTAVVEKELEDAEGEFAQGSLAHVQLIEQNAKTEDEVVKSTKELMLIAKGLSTIKNAHLEHDLFSQVGGVSIIDIFKADDALKFKIWLKHCRQYIQNKPGGKTLWHFAAQYNAARCIRCLNFLYALDHAYRNDKDADGRTPLMEAAMNDSFDAARELIKSRVNVALTDNDGDSAFALARSQRMKILLASHQVVQRDARTQSRFEANTFLQHRIKGTFNPLGNLDMLSKKDFHAQHGPVSVPTFKMGQFTLVPNFLFRTHYEQYLDAPVVLTNKLKPSKAQWPTVFADGDLLHLTRDSMASDHKTNGSNKSSSSS